MNPRSDDTKVLLIETANNVAWLRNTVDDAIKRLEAQRLEQYSINEKNAERLSKVEGRMWMLSGGILSAHALLALAVGWFKK